MKKKYNKFRFLTIIGIGHSLEIYDFTIYFFLSPFISEFFFPSENKLISVMLGYSVLIVGLLIRPLGSIVIGIYGDKFGRKKALILTMYVASFSTFAMSILPTYREIGLLSPILLIICRMLQGFSFGGEFAGSIIFTFESTTHKQVGIFLGFLTSFASLGVLLASGISTLCVSFIDKSWCWKIPIFLGSAIAVIGYNIRTKLDENRAFLRKVTSDRATTNNIPLKARNLNKQIIYGIGLTFLNGGLIYLSSGFLNFYFTTYCNFSVENAMLLNTLGVSTHILFYPLLGFCLDKVGFKVQIIFAIIMIFTLSYPIFWLFQTGDFMYAIIGKLLMGGITSAYTLAYYFLLASLFRPSVRYFGFATSQGLGQAILGGLSPIIVTHLISITDNKYMPAIYLMILAILSFIAFILALKLPTYKGNGCNE